MLKYAVLASLLAAASAVSCSEYCTRVETNCAGDDVIAEYKNTTGGFDSSLCLSYCSQFLTTGETADVTSGNSLECRYYHAGSPAQENATLHCPHASPLSADGACGTPCEAYCFALNSNCTGDNLQTPTTNQNCLDQCALYPANAMGGATGGNSLQCRRYHLMVAGSDPDTHCAHAGPSGGGACGTPCESYCQQAASSNCTEAIAGGSFSPNCATECALIPETNKSVATTSGNSLQCRLYHNSVASVISAQYNGGHCAHASPLSGASQCGDTCDNFCDVVMSACTGANAQYATKAECVTACGLMPVLGTGTALEGSVASGNSVNCRMYHAAVSASSSSLALEHCPHAGVFGSKDLTQVCGNICDAYCDLSASKCGSNYATVTACQTACANMTLGALGDTGVDTVHCRHYHLTVAASFADGSQNRTDHCTHASENGGGVCVAPPTTGPKTSAPTGAPTTTAFSAGFSLHPASTIGLLVALIASLNY